MGLKRAPGIAMRTLAAGFLMLGLHPLWAQPANNGKVDGLLSLLAPAEQNELTKRKRFNDYVLATVGPVTIVAEAAGAGISQWQDSPTEWGQGGSGFGKRFGNNMAYNAVRTTITYGLSAALREDNRYFGSHRHGIGARIGYALISPGVAHQNGHAVVSVSSLAGIAGAATISQAWAPSSWQGAGHTASNFGWTWAGLAGYNLAREFVPDIVRHFRH
jgi:hypothetical protein